MNVNRIIMKDNKQFNRQNNAETRIMAVPASNEVSNKERLDIAMQRLREVQKQTQSNVMVRADKHLHLNDNRTYTTIDNRKSLTINIENGSDISSKNINDIVSKFFND